MTVAGIPVKMLLKDLGYIVTCGVGFGGLVGGVIGWLTYTEEDEPYLTGTGCRCLGPSNDAKPGSGT